MSARACGASVCRSMRSHVDTRSHLRHVTIALEQLRQRLGKRCARDAALGDDRRHVLRRRHVERRVADLRAVGRQTRRPDVRDLAIVALLDRNPAAVRRVQIDGGERRGDVERNAVLLGQHGDAVGADLVGDVAVGGDAIGADDDQIDLTEPHHRAGHVVGDDRRVDAVPDELPRGQPRALQKRPRLVGEHGDRSCPARRPRE